MSELPPDDVLEVIDQLARLGLPRPRGALRRLLPNPAQESGWERMWNRDLAQLSSRDRYFERLRLERAIVTAAGPEDVPPWLWDRLRALRALTAKPTRRAR